MIAKASLGSRFWGLQQYLLKTPPERVSWVETRNLLDIEHASLAMETTAEQNTRVKRPVYHLTLSASPDDHLTREKWGRVADRVLCHLGLERHQVLIVAHHDREHPHIHLMLNRVDPVSHRAWSTRHDRARLQIVLREVEREFGLQSVRSSWDQARPVPELRLGEVKETQRLGPSAWTSTVRRLAAADLQSATSWDDLAQRLGRHGLRLERARGGLVLTDGQRRVRASRVHRTGSYRRLNERFGETFGEWRKRSPVVRQVHEYRSLSQRQHHLEQELALVNQRLATGTGDRRSLQWRRRALESALQRLPPPRRPLQAISRAVLRHGLGALQQKLSPPLARSVVSGLRTANLLAAPLLGRHLALEQQRRHLHDRLAAIDERRGTLGDTTRFSSALRRESEQLLRERARVLRRLQKLPPSREPLEELVRVLGRRTVQHLTRSLSPPLLRVALSALRTAQLLGRSVLHEQGRER